MKELTEETHLKETGLISLIIKSMLPQPGGTLARRSGRASRRTMLSSLELTNPRRRRPTETRQQREDGTALAGVC